MKFIDPDCYWKEQGEGMQGVLDMMTFAGRLTHNTESKVGDSEEYIERMKALGHGRVFEFGTIYLTVPYKELEDDYYPMLEFYNQNGYSRVNSDNLGNIHITTNYRVLLQGDSETWTDAIYSNYAENRFRDLEYMTENNLPTEHHIKRYTIVWDMGIGRATAASFRTHCALSTLMMSTRYCKFSSPKYGNSLPIARQYWMPACIESGKDYSFKDIYGLYIHKELTFDQYMYYREMSNQEMTYFDLTRGTTGRENFEAWPAEKARGILGLDLATKMIQCGFEDDWKEFFRQRAQESEHPHPDALYIAKKAIAKKPEIEWIKRKEQ